jgi:hypothetical protein
MDNVFRCDPDLTSKDITEFIEQVFNTSTPKPTSIIVDERGPIPITQEILLSLRK